MITVSRSTTARPTRTPQRGPWEGGGREVRSLIRRRCCREEPILAGNGRRGGGAYPSRAGDWWRRGAESDAYPSSSAREGLRGRGRGHPAVTAALAPQRSRVNGRAPQRPLSALPPRSLRRGGCAASPRPQQVDRGDDEGAAPPAPGPGLLPLPLRPALVSPGLARARRPGGRRRGSAGREGRHGTGKSGWGCAVRGLRRAFRVPSAVMLRAPPVSVCFPVSFPSHRTLAAFSGGSQRLVLHNGFLRLL